MIAEKTALEHRIAVLQIVDRVCEEFERKREAGVQVEIDDYVNRAAPEIRDELFVRLLRSQLIDDVQQQCCPLPVVYMSRYPDHGDAVQRVFAELEELYPQIGPAAFTQPAADAQVPAAFSQRFVRHFRLGVGGQGEVWLAQDRELERFVALKVIRESERRYRESRTRFWREAHVTSKLEHPNIVPIYEAGRIDDDSGESIPYYAMRVYGNRHLLQAFTAYHGRERDSDDRELLEALAAFHNDPSANEDSLRAALSRFAFDDSRTCDRELRQAVESLLDDRSSPSGRDLGEAIDDCYRAGRPMQGLRELLTRFIDMCNALAYAHSRGVIHRDLKPDNVMLGEFGETLVVDWGLAKIVGSPVATDTQLESATLIAAAGWAEHDSATRTGDVNGTLAYMSPEQAWGRIDELRPATDIYSLGAILYVILTGQPPRSGSFVEQRAAAEEGRIAPPSSVRSDVPRALEAVCLKAMSKSPEQRYANAKDLADEVRNWLAGEPVSAWREPFSARLRRWARRRPALTAGVCVTMLALVSASMGYIIIQGNHVAKLSAEVSARQRQSTLSEWDLARRFCEDGEVVQGMLLMARSLESLPPEDEFDDLQRSLRIELAGWQRNAHSISQVWEHPAAVTCLDVTDDGDLAATGCADGNVRIWDVASGTMQRVLTGHIGAVNALAFAPNGDELITGGDDGRLLLWNVSTGVRLAELTGHTDAIYGIAISPDGAWALSGGKDGHARLWRLRDRALLASFKHVGVVRAVGFHPDGRQFFTAGQNSSTRHGELFLRDMCELGSSQFDARLEFKYQVRSAAFSDDGQYLVVGDDDWECSLWDVAQVKRLAVTDYAQGQPGGVAISDDGNLALVAAKESHVALAWNLDAVTTQVENQNKWGTYFLVTHSHMNIASTLLHPAAVTAVAFAGDEDSMFLTACEDGCVRVWNRAPGIDVIPVEHNPRTPENDTPEKPFVVRAVAMHPQGRMFATGGWDGKIRLWNAIDGTEFGEAFDHGTPIMALSFTPDGRSLVSGGKEPTDGSDPFIRIWDWESRRCIAKLAHHCGEVSDFSISADGSLLLAGGGGQAVLWHLLTHQRTEVTLLHGEPDNRIATAISPRGDRLLTGGEAGDARLWDVQGRLVAELNDQVGVWNCEFSRDGAYVVTASNGEQACLWDAETGEPISHLQHECSVIAAKTLGESTLAITGSEVGAQIWDIVLRRPLGDLCKYNNQVVDIALSPDENTAVLADWNGYGVIWRLPQPIEGTPSEIRAWVELMTGMRLDEAGGIVPLTAAEWRDRHTARVTQRPQ